MNSIAYNAFTYYNRIQDIIVLECELLTSLPAAAIAPFFNGPA